MAVSRRRTRESPPAGFRAFVGKPGTRRSLDLAIFKLNEIAEEDGGRRCNRELRSSIRERGGADFGDGIVAGRKATTTTLSTTDSSNTASLKR